LNSWCRRVAEGWLLSVHAQPGAKKSGVAGIHGEALKIRVAAPPLEGKANAALIQFVAQALGVARKRVSIARGEKGRAKQVLVAAPEADPSRLLGRSSR